MRFSRSEASEATRKNASAKSFLATNAVQCRNGSDMPATKPQKTTAGFSPHLRRIPARTRSVATSETGANICAAACPPTSQKKAIISSAPCG